MYNSENKFDLVKLDGLRRTIHILISKTVHGS